eukprot:TRINITY_DN23565_c0_g1_i1.p1 TRINITY_DN23565_c0_g1~~TRINITY_DN23565_c0_g1_i1.p1  ORF type:complete len:298 (-),score=38.80 TRINITY_DN23565_c0_g1_i1:542-1384(-)
MASLQMLSLATFSVTVPTSLEGRHSSGLCHLRNGGSIRKLNALVVVQTSASTKDQQDNSGVADADRSKDRLSLGKGVIAAALSASLLFSTLPALPAVADELYQIYYGTAASASSYGGYGGNAAKKDSAEYIYEVPDGWKERNISKVEKGTNGTDSEFFNPKKRTEKTYLTFLAGFRRLPPQDNVLTNLALSDVNLQDQIASADSVDQSSRRADGQEYYDYEIDSSEGHSLISVTCVRNKLYAHFVNAPASDWKRDQDMLRHIHDSFKTVSNTNGPSTVSE